MEYYNQFYPGQAASAGTSVDRPGERLEERSGAAMIIVAMKEHGIDMSKNERRQLSPEMTANFERVVVMAESETVPGWLAADTRAEFWNIADPKDQTLDVTRQIRDQIRERCSQIS